MPKRKLLAPQQSAYPREPAADPSPAFDSLADQRVELQDFPLSLEVLRDLSLNAQDENVRVKAATALGRLSQKGHSGMTPSMGAQPSLSPEQLLAAMVNEIVSGLRDGRYSIEMVAQKIEPILTMLYDEKNIR